MMQHWAAVALFQEVRLLNRYIHDAAVGTNSVPYVLRFNVGLMPRRRHLALDAYLNMSFFVGDERSCLAAQARPSSKDCRVRTNEGIAPRPGEYPSCKLGEVLPLLVTDNVESAIHSRTADELRVFALALRGMIQAMGVDANLDSLHEKMKWILARDLNSVLMVSRLTSNTLRVRFGAIQEAESSYSMVPRNQYISAIVLVPKDAAGKRLHVWTGADFVWLGSGARLTEKSDSDDRADVQVLADRYGLEPQQVECAWAHVLEGDWESYLAEIAETDSPRELWVDIAALQAGYTFDHLSVELPPPPKRTIATQVALLADDGKDTTVVHLVGGADLDTGAVCARLKFGPKPDCLPARQVTVLRSGTEVQLSFPSLGAWGIDHNANTKLQVQWPSDPSRCWSDPPPAAATELDTTYRLVAPEQKPALATTEQKLGFEVSGLSALIVAKAGKGTFQFELAQSKVDPVTSVEVLLTGADVAKVTTVRRDAKEAPTAGPTDIAGIGSVFALPLEPGKVTVVTVALQKLKDGGKVQTVFKNAQGEKLPAKETPVQSK